MHGYLHEHFKAICLVCFVLMLSMSNLELLNAQIEAPKSDSLFYDANGNLLTNPGDSIRYKLILKNNGSIPATGITVPNGTDPNTTLDPGSILTSPIASNDGPFDVVGNMGINVPAGSGVLLNDFDDNLAAATIMNNGIPMATAQGGSITIAADGGFTYNAPAGFEGPDSVTYILVDGTPAPGCPNSNDALIRFNVSGMIWFINENVTAGGNNGTINDPFETLAAFEAVNGNGGSTDPGGGDPIFIYSSPTQYTGGVTLENGQKLLGQGMTSSLASVTGLTIPTFGLPFPTVNMTNPQVVESGGGSAILLAQNNDIRGLDVGSNSARSGSGGIIGSNIGTIVVSEGVSIYTGGAGAGPGIDINGASNINIALITVDVLQSSSEGIDLNNITAGTFTISGTTNITNSTTSAVDITSSASISSTFASLNINNSTSNAPGLNASSGGTITVTTGMITTTQNFAVSLVSTTISGSGVTFSSISTNGGTTTAITLSGTGMGPFSSSGGMIQNIVNADGIRLDNTGGLVSFSNMTIQDISSGTDAGDMIGTRSGVDGIHGQMVAGGLSLNNVTLRRFSDNAIHGATFAGDMATTWNGLSITNCNISFSNRYHVPNVGDNSSEGTVRILGITGVVSVTGSTFDDGARFLEFFTHTSGMLDMTVQSSTFSRTLKEFLCMPPGTVNVGGRGISVEVQGTADAVVRIGDPAELNFMLGNDFIDNGTASIVVAHNTGATGDVDVVISQNNFIINDHLTGPSGCPDGSLQFNFPQGGVSLNPGAGTYEAILSNNMFDQVMHAAGGLGQFTMTADENGASEFIVRGNTFDLPWDGPVQVTADGNGTCAMFFENNTYTDGNVGGPNDDLDMVYPSPYNPLLVNVRNNGSLDIRFDGEVFPTPDPAGPGQSSLDVDVQASGGSLNLWLDDCTAPDNFDFDHAAGTFLLYSETGCGGPPTPTAILIGNGNTGSVTTTGTITCTGTPPTAPSIMIPLQATTMGESTSASLNMESVSSVFNTAKDIVRPIFHSEGLEKTLENIQIIPTDLPDKQLAAYFAGIIFLDSTAAGHGWYVDDTPEQNEEFRSVSDEVHMHWVSDDLNSMDLLTVLCHELSHTIHEEHTECGLLASSLESGIRKVIFSSQMADK